jgi:hypothetical protein
VGFTRRVVPDPTLTHGVWDNLSLGFMWALVPVAPCTVSIARREVRAGDRAALGLTGLLVPGPHPQTHGDWGHTPGGLHANFGPSSLCTVSVARKEGPGTLYRRVSEAFWSPAYPLCTRFGDSAVVGFTRSMVQRIRARQSITGRVKGPGTASQWASITPWSPTLPMHGGGTAA